MPETPLPIRALEATPADELAQPELKHQSKARRRDTVALLALMTADAAALVIAWFVVSILPFSELPFSWWVVAYMPFFALLAKMGGLYDRDQFVLHKTTLDEAPKLVGVAAIFALAIEGVQAFLYTGGSHPLPLWALLTVSLVVTRAVARFATVRLTAPERLVVVGDPASATLIRRKLAEDASLHAVLLGRVGEPRKDSERMDRLLGTVAELPSVLAEHQVERVVIAPTRGADDDVVDIIRLATACGVGVTVLPRMLEVIGTSVEFDDVGGQLLLAVRGFGLSPSSRVLKRSFDVLVTGLMVIALSPLLLAITVAVKASSRGPVLFRQTRVGRHGTKFQMLKFRTMTQGADERKHEVSDLNEAAPMFKIPNDPRTTRVGRLLRRRSLDELPQLFNVLRGDMSLVGPRPLIAEEDALFSGWERRRYHVAPGITGPWQILGSSRVPMGEMVKLDYLYCANWSLWLDAKTLVRTVPYVLSRRSPEHLRPGG